jgi:hypothetical protein
MGSETVVFIGGPRDLSRQALPTPLEHTYVALHWERRSAALAEADPITVSVIKSTYTLAPFTNPRNGQRGFAYIWNADPSSDLVSEATADEIARLRRDLSNERTQHRLDVEALIDIREDLKKKLAFAQETASRRFDLILELKSLLGKFV